MALEAKQVALCIKKVLRSSIRKGYRCVSEHPILFSLGVLLYLLYRSLPGFFAFLLSSSPVILCTTLLLGILLSYGDTNLPEVDEDNKITPVISAFKVENSSSDIHLEENQRFSVPQFRKNAANFKERETKQMFSFRERASEHVEMDDNVPLLRRVDEQEEGFVRRDIPRKLTPFPSMVNFHQEVGIEDLKFNQERESKDPFFMKDKADRRTSLFEGVLLSGLNEKDTSFGMLSSSVNVNKRDEMVENLNKERVPIDSAASRVREISEEKPIEGVCGTSRPACAVSACERKKLDELKIDTSKAAEDSLLDSSLGSPWARVGSQDGSSGFDSDRAESSSPDASMTDNAPVVDEIYPLLGADSTRPDPIHKDGSDTDSHVSSQDDQTDDDSNDETDNNDANDNGEEKKKDGTKEAAFIWTADDEKNLMDLGYSEMERNRRLEILMDRRRSRKIIRFDIDNNLIDINSDDAGRSVDDLSRFRVHVPHISVPRSNPFDLPYDPEEAANPGSARSILHTWKNPFDLPLEQSKDSAVSSHDNLSPGESAKTSHHDMFFRRHDSFNFGSTNAAQERCFSRFKPYFVPETVEGSTSNFQRQFSDKSESKLSSVTESDMASSVADQEDHKDLDEKDLHGEHGSPALPIQDSDLADAGSECSDGINSVDVELDHSDIDDREIALQHFVSERLQEREAYLASTKGKGCEEDYMLKSAGNSMKPPHPVADLLSWEDGDGESSLGTKSSLGPNIAAEFSEWVSSPRPAEEQSGSGDLQEYLDTEVASTSNTIVLGASNPAGKDGNVDFMSYSNNEMPLDNLIHGSMELPSEFGKETSLVISRDLHPIPEERVVENFNMQEKYELAIFTDSATALTGLHVIEEHFDVGSEGGPSSAVVSSCPPQASDSIQYPSVEPSEISNPFISMAAEPYKVDAVYVKEETAAGYLLDSDDEVDKIYPDPIEDNGIDESFLSELDAVGDFWVEPMRLDQQVPDLGSLTDNLPANGVTANFLISPQTSGNISLTVSDASAVDSGEQSPLVDDLNGTDPEFGWSLRASHVDPEQTVYNPRRRILEASSFEAMNAQLKPLCDETEVPSVTTPSAENLTVGSSELEVESGSTETDAQMVILDAESLEDIETAYKLVIDGVVDESTPDTETSHVSGVDTNSEPLEGVGPEPLEGVGQLHVIDAKSVGDIYAAFKEQSGAVANSSLEESKDNDGCGVTSVFIKHDKCPEGTHVESLHDVMDGREPEPMKTTSNMSSIEAKTIDDINAVFKKLSDDASAKSTVQAMESENACERGK